MLSSQQFDHHHADLTFGPISPAPLLKYSTARALAKILAARFGKNPTVAGKDAAAQLARSVAITVDSVTAADLRAIADALDTDTVDYTLRRSGTGVRLEFIAAT